MKMRVYFEDTDCGGIVYHSNYFKFCERARSEAFWQNGLKVQEGSCGFIVKSINNADFIKPALLGDMLEIRTKLLSCKKTSCNLRHEIYRGDEKIFQTDLRAVYVCDKKPARFSQEVMEFLHTFK